MAVDEHIGELRESSWVYLTAHSRNHTGASRPLAQGLADVCESFGFSVFASVDEHASPCENWFEALQHAEVCVIDVGIGSAVGGAELAMAYCSGRPLITLRVHGEQSPPALNAMLARHPATREIAFQNTSDCAEQLQQILSDPVWQKLVRLAPTMEDS